jgi:hypothetical protein
MTVVTAGKEHRAPIGLLANPYLCGMSSSGRARRVLVMIRGFFDDSAQGDVFLIAGWVTDYETWERFTADWRAALDSDPAIQYFKHHEAKGDPPTGQFEGWSVEQVDAKISKLVDVICRHEMYGVCSGLNVRTHNAAFATSIASAKQIRSVLKLIHYIIRACSRPTPQ